VTAPVGDARPEPGDIAVPVKAGVSASPGSGTGSPQPHRLTRRSLMNPQNAQSEEEWT
jgi:hypothetical protein